MTSFFCFAAMLIAGTSAACGAEPALIWEADDGLQSMVVPLRPGEDPGEVMSDPGRLLADFLLLTGGDSSRARVTDSAIVLKLTDEVRTERIEVDGTACFRQLAILSEVEFDLTGLLARYDTETRGQTYRVSDGRPCAVAPNGSSSSTSILGTWRSVDDVPS